MNGYVAFYRGKKIDVYAETSYAAMMQAVERFKAKRPYEVTVVLAEKDVKDGHGQQVIHQPDF